MRTGVAPIFAVPHYYPNLKTIFDKTPSNITEAAKYLPKLWKTVQEIRCSDYDILHFNFSRSIIDYPGAFDLLDIGLYSGKKIFVTCNGCDVRLREKAAYTAYSPCNDSECRNRVCQDMAFDSVKKKRIARWDQYADGIFAATPDLLPCLPYRAKYIPNTLYNWDTIQPVPAKDFDYPLNVVHAPSNRRIKGTCHIVKAVESLQKKYPGKIVLTLVEGMSRKEALDVYREADVAVDQLCLGWYGNFAIECMKMGIPTAAYFRPNYDFPYEMKTDLDQAMIYTSPALIEHTLEVLLTEPWQIASYREDCMRYVQKWHSPEYIAGLLKKEYEKA